MADANQIKAALAGLDPKDDTAWTSSGQPLVDTIRKAVGDETVTRQDITNADPAFSREALANARVQAETEANVAHNLELEAEAKRKLAAEAAAQAELDDKLKAEQTGDGTSPPALAEPPHRQVQAEPVRLKLTDVQIAQQFVKDKTEALEAAKRDLEAATAFADREIEKNEALAEKPHITNMKAIQGYLASQQDERIARAQVATDLRKIGITPDLIRAGSKLDQAMARNRNRGMKRPNLLPHAGGV